MAKHMGLGDKAYGCRRENSRFWQCAMSLQEKKHRTSTKEEGLSQAREFAENWYLILRRNPGRGEPFNEQSFKDAAEVFQRACEVITEGERSQTWVDGHKARILLHLLRYFGSLGLSQITAGKVHDYRVERIQNPTSGKTPSYSTLHDEIVTLRMVLKSTVRKEWLNHLKWVISPFSMGYAC